VSDVWPTCPLRGCVVTGARYTSDVIRLGRDNDTPPEGATTPSRKGPGHASVSTHLLKGTSRSHLCYDTPPEGDTRVTPRTQHTS